MNFLQQISQQHGHQASGFVSHYFDNIQLPVPTNSDQYIQLRGGKSSLLFLESYGCVIRFTDMKPPITSSAILNSHLRAAFTDHRHQLRPLGTKTFNSEQGNLRIDIFPGIMSAEDSQQQNPIGRYRAQRTANIFCQKGLIFDTAPGNTGKLPISTPEFPHGFEVVIDPGGIQTQKPEETTEEAFHLTLLQKGLLKLSDKFRKITRTQTQGFKTCNNNQDPQETLYGPLMSAFKKAWPEGQETPTPEAIKEFWNMMKEYQKEGLLVCSWNSNPPYRAAADNYSQLIHNNHS